MLLSIILSNRDRVGHKILNLDLLKMLWLEATMDLQLRLLFMALNKKELNLLFPYIVQLDQL